MEEKLEHLKCSVNEKSELIEHDKKILQKYKQDILNLREEIRKLEKSIKKLTICLHNLEDFNETENDLNILTKKQ